MANHNVHRPRKGNPRENRRAGKGSPTEAWAQHLTENHEKSYLSVNFSDPRSASSKSLYFLKLFIKAMAKLIKKAKESDWKIVLEILTSCTDWLSQQGMGHWEGVNTKEGVIRSIKENTVFVLFDNEKAVGTITVSDKRPFYYKEDYSLWEEPLASAVYISKLAVLPDYHRKGLASELLQFVENKARKKGIYYVRLDAVAHYKKLTDFYLERGYKIVGKGVFGNIEGNFFEKSLK